MNRIPQGERFLDKTGFTLHVLPHVPSDYTSVPTICVCPLLHTCALLHSPLLILVTLRASAVTAPPASTMKCSDFREPLVSDVLLSASVKRKH